MSGPTLGDLESAARRIAGLTERTPLLPYPEAPPGLQLLLKLENRQVTRSFKPRGALNAALVAAEAAPLSGLVTASSGNHGQAVALAAEHLGLPCLVVAPLDLVPAKRAAMESRGAEIVLFGLSSAERLGRAAELAAERGLHFVPPYDHPEIIAGQGTVGLEIDEQAGELELVIAPVGGGGLIAGVATALAARRPGLPVWGVEPEGADDARRSLAAGRRLANESPSSSACDGLRNTELGELTWPVIERRVAGIVCVSDADVRAAQQALEQRGLGPVEPSGAASVAAVLSGRLPLPAGAIVCVVSGGNGGLEP